MSVHTSIKQDTPTGTQSELTIVSPATGQIVATVPANHANDLDAAVNRAKDAQKSWASDDDSRREYLRRIADLIVEHSEELVELGALETGKPGPFAAIEPQWAADHLRWIADVDLPELRSFEAGGEQISIERRPMGVVGAIVPWNVPTVMSVHKFAAAARMGNTVILKPSPFSPLATIRWAELANEILPEGVLQIVVGHDDLGKALVAHPGIDMIAFTGSTATGQAIMRSASSAVKPLALELGGNDAAIVLPDAPIEEFAEQIFMGAFLLSGQVCQAIKRLYVHRSQYEKMGDLLVSIAENQILGGPDDQNATFGPLITEQQLNRVHHLVEDARERGARILTGGQIADRSGNFYLPTILMDVPEDAAIVQEEQFGPALPVLVYDDIEDALARANQSDYGLGGSVWTADEAKGLELARRLSSGSVWVNAHATIHPSVPFGGVKQSGIGREGGLEGLLGYAETLTVHLPSQASSN